MTAHSDNLNNPVGAAPGLTRDEAAFALTVFQQPACTLATAGDACLTPERLGLVRAIGFYKWVPQASLRALLMEALTAAPLESVDPMPAEISLLLRRRAAEAMPNQDDAKLMVTAADECERFYSGMVAWKQTAQKKDRDWQAERMARVDDRITARASASTPSNGISTWRKRIGQAADFPLHVPTDVERAMVAEIADLRGALIGGAA